jgi:hypothetical protein
MAVHKNSEKTFSKEMYFLPKKRRLKDGQEREKNV